MTAHKPGDPTTLNRLYGRARGKPLRAGARLLDGTARRRADDDAVALLGRQRHRGDKGGARERGAEEK